MGFNPANLNGIPAGYPSRRLFPYPQDNPGPYDQPPNPEMPMAPQMTAAAPPRPDTPGPGEQHFRQGAIPGENQNAHGEKDRSFKP